MKQELITFIEDNWETFPYKVPYLLYKIVYSYPHCDEINFVLISEHYEVILKIDNERYNYPLEPLYFIQEDLYQFFPSMRGKDFYSTVLKEHFLLIFFNCFFRIQQIDTYKSKNLIFRLFLIEESKPIEFNEAAFDNTLYRLNFKLNKVLYIPDNEDNPHKIKI